MSSEKIAGEGTHRALFLGLAFVLVAATLLVYSPALSQSPLFDESFLVAWLSHCLKSGLTANDTTAYLLAPAADPRDGLTVLGAANLLTAAIFTGTSYNVMRFWQVILHLINACLLFAAVYGTMLSARNNLGQTEDETAGAAFDFKAYALGAVAAIFFSLFPLAPEAVASLFAMPIELSCTSMLLATVIFIWTPLWPWPDLSSVKRTQLLIVATVLGILSPWISLKGAFLFSIPLILLVVAHGFGNLIREAKLRPLLISVALIIAASAPSQFINLKNQKAVPETVKQLTIEKISLTTDADQSSTFLESGAGANIVAMALPVNRNIDEKYNKVLRLFYMLLPLPALLFLAALLSNARFRLLGLLTLGVVGASAFTSGGVINGQNFYGARWLYPTLPAACLLWAMMAVSPLFIETGKRLSANSENTERIIKVSLCTIFVLASSVIFFQRTYRQSLSYKSNGKLWKVVQASITLAGQQKTSPYVIVRNLPQSLSVEPILSPFSPQLIDSQSGLPRTASLSAGRLKDGLRAGKFTGIALHYEKQYEGFAGTDIKIVDKPFGPELGAKKISELLKPPLMYYNGAIKLDEKKENLLMESHTRAGPAICMECYGLSPIDGDFLFVEAKVDVPKAVCPTGQAKFELHWLTNWLGDWEARDRRVMTTGPVSDGQYHRYYFPLRTLAWTTSGLPTNLMLGFPGGATVSVRSMGLCTEKIALPQINISAVHKQDSNKNYFSHYCFDYPDVDELGLCAVYGHDNGLDINYDVSAIEGAVGAKVEIVPLSEAFRNENSGEPLDDSLKIDNKANKGNVKVASEQLAGGGLFSVRVFAVGADGKIIGHASDSLKCLVDQRL